MGSPEGGKAAVTLEGKRLVDYAIEALEGAGLETAVVAKASSPLPDLSAKGVAVLEEPEQPLHPLTGIVAALEATPDTGSAVIIGCDTPLIDSALISRLTSGPPTTIAQSCVGRVGIQPLIGHYSRNELPAMQSALTNESALIATVKRLDPRLMELPPIDCGRREMIDASFNVNRPQDILVAARVLRDRAGATT